MSYDDKVIMKAYMKRKIVTFPFFLLMIVALFPLFTNAFQWTRGQLLWHKTEAEIMVVSENDTLYFCYNVTKEQGVKTGSVKNPRLLWLMPLEFREEHDSLRMAYSVKEPGRYLVFPKAEMQMLNWLLIFLYAFVMYFKLESHMKKISKIKIAG